MSRDPFTWEECEKFRRWAEQDEARIKDPRCRSDIASTHAVCVVRDLRWFATVADARTRALAAEEEAAALRLRVAELEARS